MYDTPLRPLQPLYSTFPLTKSARAHLNSNSEQTPRDPASNLAPISVHWLVSLVEGARFYTWSEKQRGDSQVLRVKSIPFNGGKAFLLKAGLTKARVILSQAGDIVTAHFSRLSDPTPHLPHVPLYAMEGAPGCKVETYHVAQASALLKLTRDCAHYLSEPTPYSSREDFLDIPLTQTLGAEGAFWYGEILAAECDEAKGVWRITARNSRGEHIFKIKTSAIRFKHIKIGYHLIYGSPELADIASFNELQAYYADGDCDPYDGVPPRYANVR